MTSYHDFMKNVKITLCFLLIIALADMNVNIVLAENGRNCIAWYQDIYKTEIMKTSDGFFSPTIGVCYAWPACSYCFELSPNECDYYFPSNVLAVDDPHGETAQAAKEKKGEKLPEEDVGKPHICACRVWSCSEFWDILGMYEKCMGEMICFKYPLAPGPPPFCPYLNADNQQSVVSFKPVEFTAPQQTIVNSQIRVSIHTDQPQVYNLEVKRLDDITKKTTQYGDYTFEIDAANPFVASITAIQNSYHVNSARIPLPHITKPKVLAHGANEVKLQFYRTGKDDKITEDSSLIGQIPSTHPSGLAIVKPKMGNDHKFEQSEQSKYAGYVHDDNSQLSCVAGLPYTTAKYIFTKKEQKGIKYYWVSDLGVNFQANALITTETEDQGPQNHYFKCDGEIKIEKMSQQQLNEITMMNTHYVLDKDDNKTTDPTDDPCNQNKKVYSYAKISKMKEQSNEPCEVLSQAYDKGKTKSSCTTQYKDEDTDEYMWLTRSEVTEAMKSKNFVMRDVYNEGLCSHNFKTHNYTATGASNSQNTDQNSTNYNYDIWETKVIKVPKPHPNPSNSRSNRRERIRRSTNIKESVDKSGAFDISNKIAKVHKISRNNKVPTETLAGTDQPPEETEDKVIEVIRDNCQYIKVEAWGGGASGYRDDQGNYYTGDAGGFTMITFDPNKLKDYKSLKIQVGKGGKAMPNMQGKGNDTVINLCKERNGTGGCKPLIAAPGGKNNHINNYFEAIIDDSSLFYPRFSPTLKGQSASKDDPNPDIAVPYLDPYTSKGYYKHDGCTTKSNTSTDITAVINPNNTEDNANNNSDSEHEQNAAKNRLPGSGGCVNSEKNILQDGASGKVIITCEKFTKDSEKK